MEKAEINPLRCASLSLFQIVRPAAGSMIYPAYTATAVCVPWIQPVP